VRVMGYAGWFKWYGIVWISDLNAYMPYHWYYKVARYSG
jgi:hypothetical protein